MGNKMFVRELIGKRVETVNGTWIGTLDDLVVDTNGGGIEYLLISASGANIPGSQKIDERGRLVVKTERIRIEDDTIIIN